jgi:hypothetical protein
MSRDWVIDKMTVGVTYDLDIDKAKKLIKQIGKDLAADPEIGHHIIEPLKMQGVEQFGDYAIQPRMKMMTKPGEQFVIRRRALLPPQEGLRRERHPLRLPDRADRGRRRRGGRRRAGAGGNAGGRGRLRRERDPAPPFTVVAGAGLSRP